MHKKEVSNVLYCAISQKHEVIINSYMVPYQSINTENLFITFDRHSLFEKHNSHLLSILTLFQLPANSTYKSNMVITFSMLSNNKESQWVVGGNKISFSMKNG